MISHELKCIFIHIPKAAGTSIECKLGHFEELARGIQDHRTLRHMQSLSPMDLILQNPKYRNHFSYKKDILKRYYYQAFKGKSPALSHQQYKTYYKFSFVRNSWSRAFSWYKNVMRDPIHQENLGIPADCSFKAFLFDYPNQWALASQLNWLLDSRGNLPYDFIGRFETLLKDFSKVCDDLAIKDKTLPRLLTNGKRYDYLNVYDDEMKDFVANAYKDEIKLFKFEFGE